MVAGKPSDEPLRKGETQSPTGVASVSLFCQGLSMKSVGTSENVRWYASLNYAMTVFFLQLSVIASKLLYRAFHSLDYDRA